ncbi:MAG: winged helix-turn-helix transcriptional regulator [Chloroflexi bacterium]|nr:MAG: winged helix-turn-helix transcriptional regulator [Chloroflexota bacterium]
MRTERAVAGARRAAAGPSSDLLVDLATRFYVAGQSQIEIARALGLDASTVSRYLKRARDEGIVHVEIKRPRSLQGDLALELASTFHLKKAVVVAGPPGPGSGDAVAKAAADLARHLASLHPRSRVHYLHAPVLVDSPDIKEAMMRDRSIRAALESAASAEVALVGIGTLDDSAPLIRDHHISPRDRQRLLAQGAVGDMSTRFFNSEGEPVHVLDDRLIAVEWEQLKGVPLVIAMASGLEKRAAILGALRAACMDVLITDELTARSVLKAGRTG